MYGKLQVYVVHLLILLLILLVECILTIHFYEDNCFLLCVDAHLGPDETRLKNKDLKIADEKE